MPQSLQRTALLRKVVAFTAIVGCWEVAARWYDNSLMLPSFTATLAALYEGIAHGPLISQVGATFHVLLLGFVCGIGIATALTLLAKVSQLGADLVDTLTAMLNPIPSVAILPLALMWFGVSISSLVFVVTNAVVWPLTLNMIAGLRAVPLTWRLVGENFELSRGRQLLDIYIPAAFPQILAGLKVSWAFAWRTLIASELVFGVSSGSGGIGWFIFSAKNQLETPSVFAGLLTVVLIGLLTENVIFEGIERLTVRRWGMVR